ncbi:hypothetical protein D3C81_2130060 [compost metagenome]
MAPILVPALNRPVAKARSFLGNHSATALMPPGKPPASPTPRIMRAMMKCDRSRAAPCIMWPICQIRKAIPRPQRAPILSITRPKIR